METPHRTTMEDDPTVHGEEERMYREQEDENVSEINHDVVKQGWLWKRMPYATDNDKEKGFARTMGSIGAKMRGVFAKNPLYKKRWFVLKGEVSASDEILQRRNSSDVFFPFF